MQFLASAGVSADRGPKPSGRGREHVGSGVTARWSADYRGER